MTVETTLAIRRLASQELTLYSDHLKRLGPDDRYLRFGYQISDEQIVRYVETQFRTKSTVMAHFDDDQNVIAAMEIVYSESKFHLNNEMAEIGLSVEEDHRGKGLGTLLFKRALILARNRGVKTMVSHCLSQNRFMMRIAKANGMTIHSESGDSTGSVELSPPNVESILKECIGEGMGLWDYGMLKIPSLLNYGDFVTHNQKK
jgi:predicted acetyltransferase